MTLEELGFNAQRLTAGFIGGVLAAFFLKQKSPSGVIGSVVAGTFTANYFGQAASHYIGSWIGDGAAAFLVGLSAMGICQGVVAIVQARMNKFEPRDGAP